MRILLVENSPTVRNIQRNALKKLGYEDVVEAADGVQALLRLGQQRVDLLLVDWNLPAISGLALVRKIRATDRRIPIIMVTTEADKPRVMEAVRAGANNYVIKPFTTEALGEKIARTLARRAKAKSPAAR